MAGIDCDVSQKNESPFTEDTEEGYHPAKAVDSSIDKRVCEVINDDNPNDVSEHPESIQSETRALDMEDKGKKTKVPCKTAQVALPVLEKVPVTFLVYCVDKNVKLCCKQLEGRPIKMKCLNDNIHTVTVNVASKYVDAEHLTYRFMSVEKSIVSIRAFVPEKVTTEDYWRTTRLPSNDVPVRDYWSVFKNLDEIPLTGFKAHCMNIFQNCKNWNLPLATEQIYTLFQTFREHSKMEKPLTETGIADLIQTIAKRYKKKHHDICLLALFLSFEYQSKDKSLCCRILESIKNYDTSFMYVQYRERLPTLLYSLSESVHSEKDSCLILFITDIIPFLNAKDIYNFAVNKEPPIFKANAVKQHHIVHIVRTLMRNNFESSPDTVINIFKLTTDEMSLLQLQSLVEIVQEFDVITDLFVCKCLAEIDQQKTFSKLKDAVKKISPVFHPILESSVLNQVLFILSTIDSQGMGITLSEWSSLDFLCDNYCSNSAKECVNSIIDFLVNAHGTYKYLLPKLLKSEMFANDKEYCKERARSWLKERTKNVQIDTNAFLRLYDCMDLVCELPAIDQKTKENLQKETLLNFSLDVIFPTVLHEKHRSKLFEKHLGNHIKDVVDRTSFEELQRVSCSLFTKGSQQSIDRFQGELLSLLMEAMKPLEMDNPVNVITHILKNKTFWFGVLQQSGEGDEIIKGNGVYRNIKKCFGQLQEILDNGFFDFEFTTRLEEEGSELNEFFTIISGEDSQSGVVLTRTITYACDRMNEMVKRMKDMNCKLRNIYDNFPLDSPHHRIEPFSIVLKYIQEQLVNLKRSHSEDAHICKYEKLMLWNYYQFLSNSHENLKYVVQSKMFWEVNNKFWVEEKDDEIVDAVTDPVQTNLNKIKHVFKELLQKYIPEYRRIWEPIIKHLPIKVHAMKQIFNHDTVDEEIEIYTNLAGNNCFDDKDKEVVKSFFKLQTFQRKIKILCLAATQFDIQPFSIKSGIQHIEQCLQRVCVDLNDTTLWDLSSDLESIANLSAEITDNVESLLESLTDSKSLLHFLLKVTPEEIAILVESVEEYSEQIVRGSTISSLIDTEYYLRPFLEKQWKNEQDSIRQFLNLIQTRGLNLLDIAGKVVECNANISCINALYDKHKDRNLRTIEIISNILQYGTAYFKYGQRDCDLYVNIDSQIHFRQPNLSSSNRFRHFNISELLDLKSRAHLLLHAADKNRQTIHKDAIEMPKQLNKTPIHESLNREETNERFKKYHKQLETFIKVIDAAIDTVNIYGELQNEGHYVYSDSKEVKCEITHVEVINSDLKDTLRSWSQCVRECREVHACMNFLHSSQIEKCYCYLLKKGKEIEDDVYHEFQYIQRGIDVPFVAEVDEKYFKDVENVANKCISEKNEKHQTVLNKIVELLNGILQRRVLKDVLVLDKRRNVGSSQQYIKKTFFIAKLKEKSKLGFHTMIALYMEIAHVFPEANQVIICTRETQGIDLDLLVGRFTMKSSSSEKTLYCVVNADLLSNRVLEQFINTLDNMPEDNLNILAVVFRGNYSHPFLERYSNVVEKIEPLTALKMNQFISSGWPTTLFITSDKSGVGKTEYIREYCMEFEKLALKRLHVSGKMDKEKIMTRIKKLKMTQQTMLHIDIGVVDNPEELDIFLFELILFKYMRFRDTSVFLNTDHVCIEVANTTNNFLVDNLSLLSNFTNIRLQMKDYNELVVNKDMNSPIQIACHYMQALHDNRIDDTDLVFSNSSGNSLKPLQKRECCEILDKYFQYEKSSSYVSLNIFLSVFAAQLRNLTVSDFFKSSHIKEITFSSKPIPVRSSTVKAMLKVSKEFSQRCVVSSRTSQEEADFKMTLIHKGVETIEEKKNTIQWIKNEEPLNYDEKQIAMKDMIRWEDVNHILVAFHQKQQTFSLLYKNLNLEPDYVKSIKEFFESQNLSVEHPLNEYDETALKEMLRKITMHFEPAKSFSFNLFTENYVLTPDNVLKFVLILFRIHANIPVVLLGDTGCGKTSLITILSKICNVELEVFNIHAGTKEEDIVDYVHDTNKKALSYLRKNKKLWLFFDEINTSDCLGLLSDIVCHHLCYELQLSPNLCILAACNPYRFRENIYTAGLLWKSRKKDKLSNLVYRVHPLPDSLMNFVWDFGTLADTDEKEYIKRMLKECSSLFTIPKLYFLFIKLVVNSQTFVRIKERTEYSVSLRDVERCRHLLRWFMETYFSEKDGKNPGSKTRQIKAISCSLHLCYCIRFQAKGTREEYMKMLENNFFAEGLSLSESPLSLIENELHDVIQRMEIPKGIAVNDTLAENVYVMMICALNCIPLFVVGKPGCSKTLAFQLLRSNLRGNDSKDEFFKTLPYLYCVTYQGSQSSTSAGIEKAYKKAEKYQLEHGEEKVRALLIFDEVGQAEQSASNPLKVLHSLLVSKGKKCSVLADIAVIGISNWALDAAKMNRAIHLSRPEMNEVELTLIGTIIHRSLTSGTLIQKKNKKVPEFIKQLVRAYKDYMNNSNFEDFHGLRDFYSLVRYVSQNIGRRMKKSDVIFIKKGILRNFSGLPQELSPFKYFEKHINERILKDHVPTLKLLEDNIKDENSRHLMLISSGDAAIATIEKLLVSLKRDFLTFVGGTFPKDCTEDYNYRVLSEVILCMENGQVLIFKNLQNIYGTLYDMLNQSYCVVGGRQHCRVALGEGYFPMCYVKKSFKCVLILDENEVNNVDPPLLNRFEKQRLSLVDLLDDFQKEILHKLERLFSKLLKFTTNENIKLEMLMPTLGRETLSTLVMAVTRDYEMIKLAKQQRDICIVDFLLFVFNPEMVILLNMSILGKEEPSLIQNIQNEFWKKPVHKGLAAYLCSPKLRQNVMIFTHSSLNVNVKHCLKDMDVEIQTISDITSEREFQRIVHCFNESDSHTLIVRFPPEFSVSNMMCAKSVVERETKNPPRQIYLKRKRIVFLIHLDRDNDCKLINKLDFVSMWDLATVDSLNVPFVSLPDIVREESAVKLLSNMESHFLTKENMYWAFTRIHYIGAVKGTYLMDRITKLIDITQKMKTALWECIIKWLQGDQFHISNQWLFDIAKENCLKTVGGTFISAIEKYLIDCIRKPLAVLLYQLERHNVLQFFITKKMDNTDENVTDEKITLWCTMLKKQDFLHNDTYIAPTGPGCFHVQYFDFKYKIPFGKCIVEKVERLKDHFCPRLLQDVNRRRVLQIEFVSQLSKNVCELRYLNYKDIEEDYIHDFLVYFSSIALAFISQESRINVLNWVRRLFTYSNHSSFSEMVCFLHTTFWIHSTTVNLVMKLIQLALECGYEDTNKLLCEVDDQINKGFLDFESNRSLSNQSSTISFIANDTRDKIDLLVKLIITKLLMRIDIPHCDFIHWYQTAHSVLLIAEDLDSELSCKSTLKFCLEIANTVKNNELSHLCLYGVSETFVQSTDIMLITSPQFHLALKNIVKKIDSEDSRYKIMSCYISQCVLLNDQPDYHISFLIDAMTQNQESVRDCRYLGSVLRFCIVDCVNEEEYEDPVSIGQSSVAKKEIFQRIDYLLLHYKNTGPLSLILVDILEQYAYRSSITVNNVSDENTLCTVKAAAEMLNNATDYNCIKLIACIAYIRTFIFLCAKCLEDETVVLVKSLESTLNLTMKLGHKISEEINEFQLYFLRCIEKGDGLLNLESKCGSSVFKNIDICKNFELDAETKMNHLELCVNRFCEYEKYKQFVSLMDCRQTNDTEIVKFMEREEGNGFFVIFAYCYCRFYLKQVYVELTNEDNRRRETLQVVMKMHDFEANGLITKVFDVVTFAEDARLPLFRLSQDSDPFHVHLSSFLIFFLFEVACNRKGIWMKMVTDPKYIFKYVQQKNQEWIKDNLDKSEVFVTNCKNNHRCVRKGKAKRGVPNVCTICQSLQDEILLTSQNVYAKTFLDKIMVLLCGCRDNLSKICEVLLQLFISSSLLSSFALGYITEIDKDAKLHNINQETLEKEIETNWNRLKALLAIGNGEIGALLQYVVNESKNVLFRAEVPPNSERKKWVNDLQEHFHNTLNAKRFNLFDKQSNGNSNLQSDTVNIDLILELSTNGIDFFRRTVPPSIETLHSQLFLSDAYLEFPFLRCFLDKYNELEAVAFIEPLVKWHLSTIGLCNYKMKRADSKKKFCDYLHQQTDSRQSEFADEFDSFRNAWNELVALSQKYIHLDLQLKPISDNSLIEDCFLLNASSQVRKVIEKLVSIQNDFLDETLRICVQYNCTALGFLRHGIETAAIPCASLVEVVRCEGENLVHYELSDESLRFSQNETSIGNGRLLRYNFNKIEFELAKDVLSNKTYLLYTNESLPRIQFKDVVFENTMKLIGDVEKLVTQKPMPVEIAENIRQKKVNKQELLTHSEVLLAHINHVGGHIEPDCSLVQYMTDRKDVFGNISYEHLYMQTENESLKIYHVVALYNLSEEMNGEIVIEQNMEVLSQELSANSYIKLHKLDIAIAKVFLTALRIYAYRCLNTEVENISRNVQLIKGDCLGDKSHWPDGTMIENRISAEDKTMNVHEVLDSDLYIRNIASIHRHLVTMIKNPKKRKEVLSCRSVTSKGQPKKKRIC